MFVMSGDLIYPRFQFVYYFVLFRIKLRWPKKKRVYDNAMIIIERGRTKQRDLSVASRSIIAEAYN